MRKTALRGALLNIISSPTVIRQTWERGEIKLDLKNIGQDCYRWSNCTASNFLMPNWTNSVTRVTSEPSFPPMQQGKEIISQVNFKMIAVELPTAWVLLFFSTRTKHHYTRISNRDFHSNGKGAELGGEMGKVASDLQRERALPSIEWNNVMRASEPSFLSFGQWTDMGGGGCRNW